MNTRTYLAIFLIATSIAITTTSLTTQASADKSNAREGLDKADENVHENVPGGLAGDIDKKFHEGLCRGDHSTTVLDSIGGCDNPIITDPGESDNHRQDK
jgi:hypothetical protein